MSPELLAQITDTIQTLGFLALCAFVVWMMLK